MGMQRRVSTCPRKPPCSAGRRPECDLSGCLMAWGELTEQSYPALRSSVYVHPAGTSPWDPPCRDRPLPPGSTSGRPCSASHRSPRACLLSSCSVGLRIWADESPKCVVRRAVGGNRAAAACSTSLVREAQAGSPAGGRGDRLPLPVRDRLAGPPGRLRALADGVEAPPRLVWRRNLGPHPRRAPGPRRRERGAGLVGRSRLHDLPRPPARHEPRTHHRGRRGTTRISATSLVTRACQMVCVSRTERNGTIMTMTNEKQQHDDGPSGQDLVEQLKASGQLDALFEQIDAGQVELTGDGGFVPALVKAALERGLQAELTSHLGYEKGS